MKMMAENPNHKNWITVIAETAKQQCVPLPTVTFHGMGNARLTLPNGRFVTFKRRLVSPAQAEIDGVEWTLWFEQDDQPTPVAAFRQPLEPTSDAVTTSLSLLKGWLLDEWTPDEATHFVQKAFRCRPIERASDSVDGRKEYWLSEDRTFGIIVSESGWSLQAREKCLTSWQSKADGAVGELLDLPSLDRLCSWLTRQWWVVAYGNDIRPMPLRADAVTASRAYEHAELARATKTNQEVVAWWSRHAIRAADGELPNVFFERQADDLIVSWNALPSDSRFFPVRNGEETLQITIAVPTLRSLVEDRLSMMVIETAEQRQLAAVIARGPATGYAVVKRFNSAISDDWLQNHGFSNEDAGELAASGTSRHPIVGLLRSSQGTSITLADHEYILKLLNPGTSQDFAKLREVAKGLDSTIDVREPWESGYQLARLVRERLNLAPTDYVNVEDVVHQLGVLVQDTELGDDAILGVCVGTPGYCPLVALNRSCPDATGVSGRRVTLAHELCHLLFDRGRLRSLARFEGAAADSDRLIEMRANAFAIEFLVPMTTLVGTAGTVVDNARLAEISQEHGISLHALEPHATNLRNLLNR